MSDRPVVFSSVDDAAVRLARAGYLADEATSMVAYLADRMARPVLIEGRAGVGKTEFARALADAVGAQLIRLQCYEGIDEARALYEWNYRRQLLRLQADQGTEHDEEVLDDIFGERYLIERPILRAVTAAIPTVLLIDELDKADPDFEALLLEVLHGFAITIPELGTLTATTVPYVVLTSNDTRELSEALRRRCLHLHLTYPDIERECAIVRARFPGAPEALTRDVATAVHRLREVGLRKPPSIAETLDWVEALRCLGHDRLDGDVAARTIAVFLKHEGDRRLAAEAFADETAGAGA